MAAAAAALLLLTAFLHHVSSESCTNISTSLETLLAECPREVAPAVPVEVTVWLDVRHASIDEATSTVRMLADLHVGWQDTRLQWNETLWGCDSAQTAVERLWRPDLELLNAGATSGATTDDLPARITANGNVLWLWRLNVNVPVAIDLADWPRDVQKCTFMFGSRSLSVDELVLSLGVKKHVTMSESGAWDVLSITNALSKSDLPDDERYLATWTVSLRRRAPAHSLATGAVFASTVVELVAAALLPVDSRAPLYACAAFTSALWLISALLRMPQTGTTPLSLSLISALCILSAVACVFAAIVQRVARCRLSPPGVVRSLLTAASGICKLTPDEGTSSQIEGSGAWTAAAKLTDYTLTIAQMLTLIIIVAIYMFS